MRKMARGEGKGGCIFYLLLAIVVGFAALKVVPVQVAKMQLSDHMKELAMTSPRKDAKWFEDQIYKRARDLDLPMEKKNIKVEKTSRRVIMDAKCEVVLDLVVTEYPLPVEIHLDRDLFLF